MFISVFLITFVSIPFDKSDSDSLRKGLSLNILQSRELYKDDRINLTFVTINFAKFIYNKNKTMKYVQYVC